jgi:hypothetical protein
MQIVIAEPAPVTSQRSDDPLSRGLPLIAMQGIRLESGRRMPAPGLAEAERRADRALAMPSPVLDQHLRLAQPPLSGTKQLVDHQDGLTGPLGS